MNNWFGQLPQALVQIGKKHKGLKYPILLLLLLMKAACQGFDAAKALAHPKMRRRILASALSLCMMFTLLPATVFAAEPASAPGVSSVCTHHLEHTPECGYTEGLAGTPCSHEHTEDCFKTVTDCTHEHIAECYPEDGSVSDNEATPPDTEKKEPTECSHICSEETGCITKTEDCLHAHGDNDGACGYAAGTEGTLCGFVCEICSGAQTGEAVKAVLALIAALPTMDELAAVDTEGEGFPAYLEALRLDTAAARTAYDALTDEEKAEFDPAALEKLTALEEVLAAMPMPMAGEEIPVLGADDSHENVKYTLTAGSPNTAAISGVVSVSAVTGVNNVLVIPAQVQKDNITYNVTEISGYAFQNCVGLTSVTIPSSVTTIKTSAFQKCTQLVSVTIPNSVTVIGDFAFGTCTSLAKLTIPASVTTIGGQAFTKMKPGAVVTLLHTTLPGGDGFNRSSFLSGDNLCYYYILANPAIAKVVGDSYDKGTNYGIFVNEVPGEFTAQNSNLKLTRPLEEANGSVNARGYNVLGVKGGGDIGTTYNGAGYPTYLSTDASPSYSNSSLVRLPGEGAETYAKSGIWVTTDGEFVSGGKYLRVTYTLRNSTNAEISNVSLGVAADTMIGSDDTASIYPTPTGFRMVNTKDAQADPTAGGMQFTLNCKDAPGADNVDTMWYGGWTGSFRDMVFTDFPEKTDLVGKDSAITFSWKGMTIPANDSITRSVVFGVSEAAAPPVLPEAGSKPIALYLTTDGEKNITVNAKVTDVSGVTDTLYYTINGGEEKTLGETVTADGTEKIIADVIGAENFAADGTYTVKLWIMNSKGAMSEVITKVLTVTSGAMGGGGLETGTAPVPPGGAPECTCVAPAMDEDWKDKTDTEATFPAPYGYTTQSLGAFGGSCAITEHRSARVTYTYSFVSALGGNTATVKVESDEATLTFPAADTYTMKCVAAANGKETSKDVTFTLSTAVADKITVSGTCNGDNMSGGGATLQAAVEKAIIGLGTLAQVTKLEITAGEVTAADWEWFRGSGMSPTPVLSELTEFTVADDPAVTAVADVPAGTSSGTFFPKSIKTVSIPQAKAIGKSAFEGCSKLTDASFKSATTLGDHAFYGCKLLTTASFPAATTLEESAFQNCTKLTTVSFPEVTTLGGYAFNGCELLTTVSFPEVTTIGEYAFKGCSVLDTASFPAVASIGAAGFMNCSQLKTANFPEVTTLGVSAFNGCAKLATTSFPKVNAIGGSAFNGCELLATASFPEVTTLGGSAFEGCSKLTTASFPKVQIIEGSAFEGCTLLTTTNFPAATSVEDYAFKACATLATASFPLLTTIKDDAFYGCKALAELKLPGKPPSIDLSTPFTYCPKVRELKLVKADGSDLTDSTALAAAQEAYDKTTSFDPGTDTDGLWFGWKVREPVVVVEAEWTPKDGSKATGTFADALTAMTANGGSIKLLTDVSTSGKTKLPAKDIALDLNGQTWTSGDEIQVVSGGTLTITGTGVGGITAAATTAVSVQSGGTLDLQSGSISATGTSRVGISNSGTVKLSGGTVSATANAVNNKGALYLSGTPTLTAGSGYKQITMAGGATVIANDGNTSSPSYSTGTISIQIPTDSIADYVAVSGLKDKAHADKFSFGASPTGLEFTYNDSTKEIKLTAKVTESKITIKINDGAEVGGASLQAAIGSTTLSTVTKLEITKGEVTTADWNWFAGNDTPVLSALTDFTVASAVTSVADIPDLNSGKTFPQSIKTVIIPQSIKIGTRAFNVCPALTSVSFPAATSIEFGAFNTCTNLTSVDFPKVTSIGKEAFTSCTKLAAANFPKAISIGKSAFRDCKALTTVSFPAATSIGDSAFSACKALTTASFPVAASIDVYAFNSCIKLATLSLGVTVPTTVGLAAFTDCPAIRSLVLVDASGNALTGSVLTTAQVEYDKVVSPDTGTDTDDLWFGWKIGGGSVTPPSCTCSLEGKLPEGGYGETVITFITQSVATAKFPFEFGFNAQGANIGGSCAVEGHTGKPITYSYALTSQNPVGNVTIANGNNSNPATISFAAAGNATVKCTASANGKTKEFTATLTVTQKAASTAPGGELTAPLTQEKIDKVFGEGNATLDESTDPDTIKINNDITVGAPIIVPAPITIDLGGNTITGGAGANPIIKIDGGTGTITGGGSINGGNGGAGVEVGDGGTVIIGGGTEINGGDSSTGNGGDAINGGGSVVIGGGGAGSGGGSANGGNGGGSSGNGGDGVDVGGDVEIGSDGNATGGNGSGSGNGGDGANSSGGDITIDGGGSSTGGSGGNNSSGTGGNGGNGTNSGNGSTTVDGETNGGSGGNGTTGGGNGGNGASSGTGSGTGDITIGDGGKTEGGSGGNASSGTGGNGGNGTSTGGSTDINSGGSSTGGTGGSGSGTGGNGGNGTDTSGTDTTINGGTTGGNGGNGTGNGNGGNGGNGANQDGGTVDGSGSATGGNGGSGAGTGNGGTGGSGVGGGASAGNDLITKDGISAKVEVTGDAGDKVKLPDPAETVDAVLTDDEKTDDSITDVKVTLKVDDKTAGKPDNTAIEAVKPSGSTVGAFFDITLQKTITNGSGTNTTNVTETQSGKKITITIEIPSNMRGGSDYVVIRVHSGTGAKLATTKSGDNLTFETDKFSTYAIAYTKAGGGTDPTPPTPPSGGGSGGGSYTPPVTIIPSDKPSTTTTAETEVKAEVDKNGNAAVTLPIGIIDAAVKKAVDEAKKAGKTENGIAVIINVSTGGKNAASMSVNLPKVTQEYIISNQVSQLTLVMKNPAISIGMDLAAITEINCQANSDVQLSATRLTSTAGMSAAKAAIGTRPVFALAATCQNAGKAISNVGGGRVTVAIPYTPGEKENPGSLYAVYADENGKVNYLTESSYDANSKAVIFTVSHFRTYAVGYKAIAFTDINGHWAKDDIEFAANRGLLSGTGKNTFSPDTSMTREMFVTALGRLAGIDSTKYNYSTFTDVKADAYYTPYVAWAAEKNIVSGTTATTFAPDQAITRQEMAVIMQNYAKAMNYTVPKTRELVNFADSGSIAGWAAEAVKSMQMAGVVSGKNDNRFDPTGIATRAEVSAVLHRYIELAIDKATAQGLDINDSGKIVYYENGRLFTGTKTIDGTTYHFGADGICTKIDAVVPDTKKYITYIIVYGDTLWDLSRKHKCTVAEIVGLNGIKDPNNVPIGTEIKIPQK